MARALIIIMQPAKYFANLSQYVKNFMKSKTYLTKYDQRTGKEEKPYDSLAWGFRTKTGVCN